MAVLDSLTNKLEGLLCGVLGYSKTTLRHVETDMYFPITTHTATSGIWLKGAVPDN